MGEIAIENAVVEEAKADGWLVRKMSYLGRVGCPDRWFLKNGRFVIIEFKKPGGPVRASQKKEIPRLIAFGAEVHVIDNIDDARIALGLPAPKAERLAQLSGVARTKDNRRKVCSSRGGHEPGKDDLDSDGDQGLI